MSDAIRISLPTAEEISGVRAAVEELAAAATRVDGVEPLGEAALLRLRHPDRPARHLLAHDVQGEVIGYLGLAPGGGSPPSELVIEAVVHPAHRRRGAGTALVRRALALTDDPATLPWPAGATTLDAWAHGDLPGAAGLAALLRFRRHRVLLRMLWSTALPLPDARAPEGVVLRTFRPGADDEAWVEVNARAFAGHPEQAFVGVAGLRERMAEPWFDPGGFFVAERAADGAMVGFHWTKVHAQPERVGEVYVVGIDPSAQGTGLGRTLTVAGLAHLAAQGLPAVILYADESNTAAVRLYERLGFVRDKIDIQYGRALDNVRAAPSATST